MLPPRNAEGRRTRAASEVTLPGEGNSTSIVRDSADNVTPLTCSTANPINLAVRLVAEIGDRAEREARIAVAAWRAGYQAGFAAGEDVGHGRAHEEIAEAWHRVAEHVRAYGRPGLYPYHELSRRRYQPGGEAYLAALARRGGREYTGGPVQWDVPEVGAA